MTFSPDSPLNSFAAVIILIAIGAAIFAAGIYARRHGHLQSRQGRMAVAVLVGLVVVLVLGIGLFGQLI